MKKWILLPGLLLACLFLTGCFGLVVSHPRQKCSTQFTLGHRGVVSNGVSATPFTEADVLTLWGPPDAKQTNADLTVWQYRGEYNWGLLVPCYLIPLPLPFPAGHNQVQLYFQNGRVRQARRPVTVLTGTVAGAVMIFAWEKEEDDKNDHGVIFGSGFIEDAKPAVAKP